MSCCKMCFQMALFSKASITIVTFEWHRIGKMFQSMQIKSILMRCAKVANVAHESLLGMGDAHVILERFLVSHHFATLVARYRLIVVFQFDVMS